MPGSNTGTCRLVGQQIRDAEQDHKKKPRNCWEMEAERGPSRRAE